MISYWFCTHHNSCCSLFSLVVPFAAPNHLLPFINMWILESLGICLTDLGAILILQTPQQPTYWLHVIPPSWDFHNTPNTPTIHLSTLRHYPLTVLTFHSCWVSTTPRRIISDVTVIMKTPAFLHKWRSLHSPVYSIWNGWIPTPFHVLHIDYFLAGNPAIFSFHSHYGVHMEWTIPWTFHVLVHVDSMWIPWNFQWIYIVNSCTIPYGFHGRIQIKFHGKTTKCVIKNSVNIKNQQVDSTTPHVYGWKCVLTAESYNCYETTHCPLLQQIAKW